MSTRLSHRWARFPWLRTLALASALALVPTSLAGAEDGKDIDWDALKARIEQAVENGDLTREEADKKYAAMKERMAHSKGARARKSDVDWEGVKRRIEEAVQNGDLTREEADRKLADLDRKMKATDGASRVDGQFRRFGVDEARMKRIRTALAQNGFSKEQTEKALGAMLRIVHEAKKEGDAFALDPKLASHLTGKMGLTQQQVDTLVGLSRRVAAAAPTDRAPDGPAGPSKEEMAEVKKKIFDAVEAGDVTKEQAEARWKAYLEHVKTQDAAKDDGARRAHDEAAVIKRKLDEAVQSGRITQADADARWRRYLEALKKDDR